MPWELTRVEWKAQVELAAYLHAGWEPLMVQDNGYGPVVWLRRMPPAPAASPTPAPKKAAPKRKKAPAKGAK